MNLDMVDRNSAPEEFTCFYESKRVGIITIETKKMWIPFSCDIFVAVSCRGISNSLIFTKTWSMKAWIPVVSSSLYFIFFYILVRLLVFSDKDQKTVGTLSYFFIMIPARKYGNSLERKLAFPFHSTCTNLNVCQTKTLWCIYLSQLTLQSLNLSFLTLHSLFAFLHLICQFKVLFVSCCWALAMGNNGTNVYVIEVYVIFVCFVLALFTVIDHSYRHYIWWGKLFFSFLVRDFPRNVAGNGRSKLSIQQFPMVYTLIDLRNDVKNIEIFAVEPTGVKTMENCHLFVKGK